MSKEQNCAIAMARVRALIDASSVMGVQGVAAGTRVLYSKLDATNWVISLYITADEL
jgi:hypothetical protein